MNKKNIADHLQHKFDFFHLTKTQWKMVVDEVFFVLRSSIMEGALVKIRDFGTFMLKERGPRQMYSPSKKEKVLIPKSFLVRFVPSGFIKKK